MNYLDEINKFYNWLMLKSIPPDAQALWHLLMQMNNKSAVNINEKWYWKTEFTISNTLITSILAFSRQQLDRMRNVLIQSGRIVYRKGRGNQSGFYKIIPFDTSLTEQTLQDVRVWVDANNVTQTVTQPVTQIDTQTGHKADTNENLCNIFGTYINNNINNKYKNNYYDSIHQSISNYTKDEIDKIDRIIKENIDFIILQTEYPEDEIKNIVDIMVDVICSSVRAVRIGSKDVDIEHVRNRFLSLNCDHIRYILDSFKTNTVKVRNIKAYIIASLYNAPATMASYYAAEVNHDMNKSQKY